VRRGRAEGHGDAGKDVVLGGLGELARIRRRLPAMRFMSSPPPTTLPHPLPTPMLSEVSEPASGGGGRGGAQKVWHEGKGRDPEEQGVDATHAQLKGRDGQGEPGRAAGGLECHLVADVVCLGWGERAVT
jgi:hypothetical protein